MKIEHNSVEFNILTYILACQADQDTHTHEELMDLFGGKNVNSLIVEGILTYDDHSDNLLITSYGLEVLENVQLPLGKNYTHPDDPQHQDDPEEWLATSLIFAKALGNILQENEGIVVKLEGDMKMLWPIADRVIVCKYDDMINILNCEEELPDGQLIWLNSPNDTEDGE
jgi:hypothetical protein